MALTLKQWRKAKDISQAKMAEELNVCRDTYDTWEKNPEKISIENAKKITRILGISIEDIFFAV